jgi:hypothetical protein
VAQITAESQRELRNQIETQFGNLFEMLLNDATPYKLCAQINEAFTRYAGNAQSLTELQSQKDTPQL